MVAKESIIRELVMLLMNWRDPYLDKSYRFRFELFQRLEIDPCPNQSTQEILSFLGKDLFQGAEKVQIGIYNSYQDMDLSNSLAA
jgi:hypothetical protein